MTEHPFERFVASYPQENLEASPVEESWRLFDIEGARHFFNTYAGVAFGGGIYRVFRLGEPEQWNENVLGIFSQFSGEIECFATDWMGRVFAWDFAGQRVLLLDPGFGEALKIPVNFIDLHDREFVEYPEESLSKGLYERFLSIKDLKERITRDQCVGYRVSPFLGGADDVENLEVIDMEVYWSVCSDIYNKVKRSK